MAIAHTIPVRTHGRYLLEPGPPERLLAGFHGYAENADASLAQMLRIPGVEQWTVVAVQALHRFYVRGTGAIVGSWMTSQDREVAIADNLDYVRGVVDALPPPRRLVFLGFSQGAAMAYRAAAADVRTSGVIALAGDCPADATGIIAPVLIGRGTREEWFTKEKLNKDLKFLGTTTKVETCIFEGGHEWTEAFRVAAGRFLGMLNG
jgi:predicted esterase